MLLQLRSTVLVIWWDKLPGLSDLVEEVTEAMEEAMGEAMEEVDLVIWWDKLPGLLDLVEEAMGEVTKEARMEEVDNMEGTSLKQQLQAILDTRLKEDTNPPRTQETTLRRPNKPLQDLLHMVAAYSATVAAPRRLF